MKNIITKVTATVLTTILLLSNLLVLGEVTAYGGELEEQDSKTNNSKVEFNSYFEDNTHGKVFKSTDNGKMYLSLKVKDEGYLKDIVVSFSNANFKIDSDNLTSEYVQNINDNKDTLTLNQIDKDEEVTLEVPITMLNEETVKSDNFARVTDVVLTATYVDLNGKEKQVNKTIQNQVEWNVEGEIESETKLTKYIPYNVGEEYGVLIQAIVSNKVKNNSTPIKEETTTIQVPTINEVLPEEVKVTANNTKSVNGKEDGVDFNESNYTYNMEEGTLEIKIQNTPDSENNIAWKKEATDEILVNFIYKGREIYDFVQSQEVAGTLNLNVNMTLYNNEETSINKDFAYEYTLQEKIGSINTVSLSTDEKISKGYIYSNYDKEEDKNETIYNEKYIVDISYASIENELELNQAVDSFELSNGNIANTTVAGNNYAYNRNIKINQRIFNKILGEDGKIEITRKDGTKIGEINKDTEKDGSGKYILDISKENTNEIIIKTSKPIREGKLELEIEKAIKTEIDYSKEQMQTALNLVSEVTLKTSTEENIANSSIVMEEPVSKANLTINKTDFSTLVKNENVEIRALLDTSDIYNSLYKNPVVEIELPEYVETIDIKSSKLLFEDELTVKEAKLIERDGKKVISIALEGTQTKYNIGNSEIQGATILISADITLDRLTPRTTSQIVMYYTNENTDLYENSNIDNETNANAVMARSAVNTQVMGKESADVNFIVPTGVLATAGISNYAEGSSEVIAITEEEREIELVPFADARTATIRGNITNNYENPISGISVLGRFPVQGNKKIDSSDDLGSNTTLNVTKGITVLGIDESQVTVYYSENAEATRDVNNTANGWTTSPADLSNVKSYLIVLNGSIEQAGTVEFNYEINIPESIGYNISSAAMYKIYYTNEAEEASMPEEKSSPIIKLVTGTGPELEVNLTSSIENDSRVFNGQYIRFYVEVKNIGKIDAQNVKVNINIPRNTDLAEYDEGNNNYTTSPDEETRTIELGNIASGETITDSFEVQVVMDSGSLDEWVEKPDETINMVLGVVADNISGEMKSNEYNYTIEEIGPFEFTNTTNTFEDNTYVKGERIEFKTDFYNKSSENMNNAVLTIPIPSGSTVNDVYIESQNGQNRDGIDIQNDKVVVNLGNIASGAKFNVYTNFNLGDVTSKSYSTKVSLDSDIGFTLFSNERLIYTGHSGLTIVQEELSNPYVKENENFWYKFIITGNGTANIKNLVLEDELASEIRYDSVVVERVNQETGERIDATHKVEYVDGKVRVTVPEVGKTETIEIRIVVNGILESDEDDGKAITNKATVWADSIDPITSNEITHYLEYNPYTEEEIEMEENGYKVSGIVWIDANKDGERQSDEATLSNVRVMLLYKENNQVVTDSDTGESKIVTTNNDGKYEFSGLDPNDYLVMFVYDSSRYTITTYQKDGVSEAQNSDAVSMDVVLDGMRTKVGMSNTVTITDKNVRNIDVGLYGEEKFDLKLDKYITKISLTTPTIGTSQTTYDNETFTKVEILRQNADKSNIVVEYKIVVTNEGAIPGYVNRIVDYLPDDVSFSTELNPDWYMSNDGGSIYNASLADTKINPGESKEVTLVLSKTLTKESLGSIMQNTAEIYEATNEAGIPDIDSEQANKLESEDDFGQASIVLSVVTGKIIGYSIIIVIALGIIVTGIIIIKKKVLNKK